MSDPHLREQDDLAVPTTSEPTPLLSNHGGSHTASIMCEPTQYGEVPERWAEEARYEYAVNQGVQCVQPVASSSKPKT